MDKEQISKELLQGVGSCKKQLKSIKSQLTMYLSDTEKRKESAESKTSDSPQERLRRKRTTRYNEDSSNSDAHEVSTKKSKMSKTTPGGNQRSRGRPRKQYNDGSDSDESYDDKDKNFTVHSSRPSKMASGKGRGRPKRRSSSGSNSSKEKSDAHDQAYNPTSYHAKPAKKSVNSSKKGRGRPSKQLKADEDKEVSPQKQDSPSKVNAGVTESEHASLDDNSSRRSQDGSFEGQEPKIKDSAKKGNDQQKDPSVDHDNASTEEVAKKRGRPTSKAKVTKEPVQQSGPKKGRGRPKKSGVSATENGGTEEIIEIASNVVVSMNDGTSQENIAVNETSNDVAVVADVATSAEFVPASLPEATVFQTEGDTA